MRWLQNISTLLSKHFTIFLIACYALSAIYPLPGMMINHIVLAQYAINGELLAFRLSMVPMFIMIFVAALNVEFKDITGLPKLLPVIATTAFGSLIVRLTIIFISASLLKDRLDLNTFQNLIVGLSLVSASPAAPASTAWTRKANGNVTACLTVYMLTNFLSPASTPLLLSTTSNLITGIFGSEFHKLASHGSTYFILVNVLLPCIFGLIARFIVGEKRVKAAGPSLSFLSLFAMMIAIYANTSTSLPSIISHPDYSFLCLALVLVMILCASSYANAFICCNFFKSDKQVRTALMFAGGINTQSSSLIMACTYLPTHPQVVLPLIMCSCIQYIAADLAEICVANRTTPPRSGSA